MNIKDEIFPTLNSYVGLWDNDNEIWQILINLEDIIIKKAIQSRIDDTAKIHPSAIVTNSIIGKNVEVYEGVTIRDSIILDNTVVGHCSEIARSILLKNCFIPRFNYVGGSFLGEGVRLGGHTTLATKRHDDKPIKVHWNNNIIDTGRWKFGSIIGNNSILAFSVHVNPGSVVGANSIIYPYVDVRGFIPSDTMVSIQQKIRRIKKRDLPDLETLIGE